MWNDVRTRAEHMRECEESDGGSIWSQGEGSDKRVEITAS